MQRRPLESTEPEPVVDTIVALYEEIGQGLPLGVGVAGFVRAGVVLASPNLPSWREVPIRERLATRLGVHVVVENDANAATLGAWSQGDGDLLLLTLGTGVGGGVVTDGRVLRGAGGTGAELGHIYVGGERRCHCGAVGCLETRLGTWGLRAAARERSLEVRNGAELVRLHRSGDVDAGAVIADAGQALGRGLATLVNLFNPDRVLISGGLAHARDALWSHAEPVYLRDGIDACVQWATVSWRPDASDLAIRGAAEAARG